MYVRPISTLLLSGKSTPAIRATFAPPLSTLTLLMTRVLANDAVYAFAANDFALVAALFDGRLYFHFYLLYL
jgi:hypothetical protein